MGHYYSEMISDREHEEERQRQELRIRVKEQEIKAAIKKYGLEGYLAREKVGY